MTRHADLLRRKQPEWDFESTGDLYYWFHGTQAMESFGGQHWQVWRDSLVRAALASQRGAGAQRGSWDPEGPWGLMAGRAYSTALMTASLAVCQR